MTITKGTSDDRRRRRRHRRRGASWSSWNVLVRSSASVLALVGLHRFSSGFFLAKRSLPHASSCADGAASEILRSALGLTEEETRFLEERGVVASSSSSSSDGGGGGGCWTERRADAVALVVVDALRFDFALERLPRSVGSRLRESSSSSSSALLRFVADPPTVTMQRLKGLTTGGLPTFADISGSFGGADVEEDSWVDQTVRTPRSKRFRGGRRSVPRTAFVGDDTWVDLFPTQFDDAHPYPSFNTRDLDTVDDGVLAHLPRLLENFGPTDPSDGRERRDDSFFFEVLVAHFLGVDHVGHTYGPHDQHMDAKLRQTDDALSVILARVDAAAETCRVAFVFGDHGMTEDGNHGGGTDDERNAALFAHYSPGCGTDSDDGTKETEVEPAGSRAEEAFRTVNQIDLVPTLSLLLGLPIPYANLGGLVPSLLPPPPPLVGSATTRRDAPLLEATALALNAAQVWNYLERYSERSNALPARDVAELRTTLRAAVDAYRSALSSVDVDALSSREAAGMFKTFLSDATDVGKRVWTRFDVGSMVAGVAAAAVALWTGARRVVAGPSAERWREALASLSVPVRRRRVLARDDPVDFADALELSVTVAFVIFHCGALTFSNSYVESEQGIVMFMLSILCLTASLHRWVVVRPTAAGVDSSSRLAALTLSVAVCGRLNELLVSGHGVDPSLRAHAAHHPLVFVSSVALVAAARFGRFRRPLATSSTLRDVGDAVVLLCLCATWYERYAPGDDRHGYASGSVAFFLPVVSAATLVATSTSVAAAAPALAFQLFLFLLAVTGPSTASTGVLVIAQTRALTAITRSGHVGPTQAPTLAAVWRLVIRHTFFATGHACSFNKLHYSAAFVWTEEFHFATAGAALFLNTFGWELLGSSVLMVLCHDDRRDGRDDGGDDATTREQKRRVRDVWRWYCFYQLLETLCTCVSVSVLKRHLMVWATFAPRFVFGAVFASLTYVCDLTGVLLLGYGEDEDDASRTKDDHGGPNVLAESQKYK